MAVFARLRTTIPGLDGGGGGGGAGVPGTVVVASSVTGVGVESDVPDAVLVTVSPETDPSGLAARWLIVTWNCRSLRLVPAEMLAIVHVTVLVFES
jgi:hypothetical protein